METIKQSINGQAAKEKLYAKEQIECDKAEYHRDVRDAILDYKLRMSDQGRTDDANYCQQELDRLDGIHGLPPR